MLWEFSVEGGERPTWVLSQVGTKFSKGVPCLTPFFSGSPKESVELVPDLFPLFIPLSTSGLIEPLEEWEVLLAENVSMAATKELELLTA